MKTRAIVLTVAAIGLVSSDVWAADDTFVNRDVNQQQRIENGLKSGELNTREAARLERGEARINKIEARDLRDGEITAQERAQLQRAQNKESQAIYREKHDGATGDPNSASSQRMQADVQRNVNQERRIEQGVQSGQLTNHEAGKLERGQARVDQREARAGQDGNVNGNEQRRIQHAENRQSDRIWANKHNNRRLP